MILGGGKASFLQVCGPGKAALATVNSSILMHIAQIGSTKWTQWVLKFLNTHKVRKRKQCRG